MSSRPRRSAAQRATVAITDMADRDNERSMSSRSRRSGAGAVASVSRGPPSSPASSPAGASHIHLTVKMPSSKLRQATNGSSKRKAPSTPAPATSRGPYGRPSAAAAARTRGEEEDDDEDDDAEEEEEEEEEKDEIEVGDRAGLVDVEDEEEDEEDTHMDLAVDDAEGEVGEMDVDAEGEEDDDADADGDIEMATAPPLPPPSIKVSKPSRGIATLIKGKSTPSKPSSKGAAGTKAAPVVDDDDEEEEDDDDDDDELSELESEPEEINDTAAVGEEDAEGEEDDDDAEGEEIEVADEDAEGEEDEELDSDEEGGSRAETPDLTKLTARQQVQAKKVFTAEELSMRRAEMARRRRNLSEKRNEEVKMETINKLLKKQAPKTNKRNIGGDTPDGEHARADPLFVRWISTKDGNRVAVPDEMLVSPAGRIFIKGGGLMAGKMVEEVS
ncbi:PAPA-1-like conserved region-domain-containing protein [Podospora didyma]|uniref:PAPA-1-like conserved region-domain-containing protein n=1 Tax=Podospora didyma TaxID=330526 RepID=A0AAE0U171_9PEZI|nr:PAPA-1-like conserved region-domain-containing protein [Podospora didyma]